ncbi:MAG: glycine dehydrogenase (aminomethyl-transferring) [gamma proteobacterium symbiont of Stewartia floridana]|nr:aminomethyl-transferring glycine dehydrogenase subunit GcvPA [Candidatus Thiodiazotropha taylori]RLW62499.1 MAG: glycine dehydrogenase (aminomethyl-transferring) [gamma proteobacterium symbiont of Stewartia floridana]MCG7908354.1 aminomethyl-transferring glycine dehydrogenase subunit GcvPA [Candidatus Thiodiazotropha taylori]MCG7924805.1 aminomethyl-transferring glycine dehydrogenase subunit GcvPA [Candidatus Thiodiazotropha taylori]MCG7944517.1 aminomethyl-transferring glycine dehydrogenase
MPFIPHTEDDIQEMLATIGVESIDDLFDEIPTELRCGELQEIPPGLPEMEVASLMQSRARTDGEPLCFIGAGAYDHHIPAAVWELTTRGEFYTAYTPYQAEASQGTLQLLYEFQSMMTGLTAMDVSNASLYDGASALAEAVLMAVRGNRKSKSKRILLPANLHPHYRRVARSIVRNQKIELVEVAYDKSTGQVDMADLEKHAGEDYAALVIPQPNFFGVLEQTDLLTDWAHQNGMLAIAVVNPLAMSLLKPAGEWGEQGADICCGEGQPLGAPLASGGPYFGFLCCTDKLVRQMPGRIIGKTVDMDGKPGYALTLQAREQHIRRSKATSNICTNQGLMVTAATIHMAIMGAEGLQRVAATSHANTQKLSQALSSLPGVEPLFSGAVFHEQVMKLPIETATALGMLASDNVLGGFNLQDDYPELGDAVLVCATELRSDDDIENYRGKLEQVIQSQAQTPSQ